MTRSKGAYTKQVTVHLTPEMFQFLDLIVQRQQSTVSDVIREAIREYLDEQEGVIGSRSRFANRIARQMEIDRNRLDAWGRLIVAAQLAVFIRQGSKGSQILQEMAKVAQQAEDQIKAIVDGATKAVKDGAR